MRAYVFVTLSALLATLRIQDVVAAPLPMPTGSGHGQGGNIFSGTVETAWKAASLHKSGEQAKANIEHGARVRGQILANQAARQAQHEREKAAKVKADADAAKRTHELLQESRNAFKDKGSPLLKKHDRRSYVPGHSFEELD